MLVIEYQSNGKRVVKLHKDWHPGRMSRAYMPPMRNHVTGKTMLQLQEVLLRRDRR